MNRRWLAGFVVVLSALGVLSASGAAFAKAKAAVAPTFTSFSPAQGAIGSKVTLTGTGFTGATAVNFNGVASTFTVNSATKITATAPTGVTSGNIRVVNPVAGSYSPTTFKVVPVGVVAPKITSLSQLYDTGSYVTILGSGFTGATQVLFNGKAAQYFNVNTDGTSITVPTVPVGATPGYIKVINPAGTAQSPQIFHAGQSNVAPTTTGFSPVSGPVGQGITITGVGFTDVQQVLFNGTPATFTVIDRTSLQAAVPVGGTSGNIRIITKNGAVYTKSKFTVTAAVAGLPVVSRWVSPFSTWRPYAFGEVDIYGLNLSNVTAVRFGPANAAILSRTDTEIIVDVPIGAESGPLAMDYTKPGGGTGTTAVGPSVALLSQTITIPDSPTVDGAGVWHLHVTGYGLDDATGVEINGAAAPFTLESDGSLDVIVPANTPSRGSGNIDGLKGTHPFGYGQ